MTLLGKISEAEDILSLHHKKTLTHHQALAMAHLHLDSIRSSPFLSSVLMFMYRYLIITTSLPEEKEGTPCNYDKTLANNFVRDHLQPAVALAITTERQLSQRRSWRLPSFINYHY